MSPLEVAIIAFGVLAVPVSFWFVRRDAGRMGISRPTMWAGIFAAPIAVGTALFAFTDAPMTGILLTANTGTVLYGFEREVSQEDDDSREPGTLPNQRQE